MDENSCKDETSKSVENVVDGQKPKEVDNTFELEDMNIKTGLENQKRCQVSERCGSSYDASASGTSTSFSPLVREPSTNVIEPSEPKPAEQIAEVLKKAKPPPPPPVKNNENQESSSVLPTIQTERRESQPRVRMAPVVEEQLATRRGSIGPPPSYSFVMKQKKKLKLPTADSLIANRPPPPAYTGNRGLFVDDDNRFERMYPLPSFGDPIWRSHSQPAYCHRCGIIVLTSTHAHDSIATHVAALVLCLFGCWPCCLLPYCMSVCKNTYHHCPSCQSFLGAYSPW